MNLRWSWDAADPRPVPLGRPRRLGRHGPRSGAPARPRARGSGSTRWPPTPASCASSARCDDELAALPRRRPAGSRARDGVTPLRSVAYFSPEFGIAEALPQYSGGLGVLAGDHLKAASDLGVPLVGIGLFYRHGYFRQALSVDGWQQERYPDLDPYAMALTLCDGVRVDGRPGRRAARRPGVAGRRGPHPALPARRRRRREPARPAHDHRPPLRRRHRAPPAPGDPPRHRRRAGARRARHRRPGVPHQRGPRRLPRPRAHPPAASSTTACPSPRRIEAVRAGCVFTTHTPVPAGIDRFPRELIERYFGGWAAECGVVARRAHGPRPPPRRRARASASTWRSWACAWPAAPTRVAKLHGEVSREMFADLWPDVPDRRGADHARSPTACTPSTWVSAEMADLLDRATCCPSGTRPRPSDWDAHRRRRATTSSGGRKRAGPRAAGRLRPRAGCASQRWPGACRPSDVDVDATSVLDPKALTICFARRFATYKRATLLLSQPERLRAAAARRATGRCSSCSPARPTRPTTPARR